MKKAKRQAYLALAHVPIPWPISVYMDIVEPIAPGRAWATPWMATDRDGWEQDVDMPSMDTACPTGLCHYCRLARWEGQCAEAELWCAHPLEVVAERSDDVSSGGDCWGFKPRWTVDLVAEFVGQRLQGKFVDWPVK